MHQTRILIIVSLLAYSLNLSSLAQSQQTLEQLADNPPLFIKTASQLLKWEEPAEPAHLVGPIYFVGTKGLSVFLIKSSEGFIILNTGMPGSGPMIEKSIRKLGFKPEEIKLILTGHAHVDHVGGHAYLKKLSGAKIAMIEQEKELFESGGKLDFHYGKYKEFGFEPAKVDQVFHDGDELKLGDVAITALLTAGHTRGSMTFVMQITEGEKQYTVAFPNGTGINPGYRLTKDPSYPGIADDLRHTYDTLDSLKPDIWLFPHNEAYAYDAKLARSVNEGGQAWVDPEGYKKWVALQREKFAATLEKEAGTK